MADTIQFDKTRSPRPECMRCEDLLADAVDGLLSESEQALFDRHIAGCSACAALLADAQRGAAWLEMLNTPRPEPSAQLLERILAQTSGAQAYEFQAYEFQTSAAQALEGAAWGDEAPTSQRALPAFLPGFAPDVRQEKLGPESPQQPWPAKVLPFRPRMPHPASINWNRVNRFMLEPRLAMTAAMAFFSIALTLNLAGVHLDQLHARDLNPASLRRSYYAASASAVRRYDNLRVVHVLESRVDDLREANRDDRDRPFGQPRRDEPRPAQPARSPAAQPGDGTHPDQNAAPKQDAQPKSDDSSKPAGPGTSQRRPILPASRPSFTSTLTTYPALPLPRKTNYSGGLA